MKRFTYQIQLDDIEYSPETVEEIYGKGSSYNPDFREDSLALETLGSLFQDAIGHSLMMTTSFLAEEKPPENEKEWTERQRSYFQYLKRKRLLYEAIQKTLKLVKSENTKDEK